MFIDVKAETVGDNYNKDFVSVSTPTSNVNGANGPSDGTHKAVTTVKDHIYHVSMPMECSCVTPHPWTPTTDSPVKRRL